MSAPGFLAGFPLQRSRPGVMKSAERYHLYSKNQMDVVLSRIFERRLRVSEEKIESQFSITHIVFKV